MIDSYLKDSVFTAVKRDESSKQGMLKGYHSSIEGIGLITHVSLVK